MITSEIINRAIDYILIHGEEKITLDDVARHCHFSKFYFSRLFKAQTGESVCGFIRRIRLEQSALRLKVERERPITDISADYGYSSSNYSSAFKLHYHTTPVKFRKSSYQRSMEHPFFHDESWHMESFEECRGKITIKTVPDYPVIYERRFGSYENLSADWNRFLEAYGNYLKPDTVFLERTYDDPAVTEAKNCLYDICMTVEEDCPLENTTVIQGGKCAVYHFKDHARHIYGTYQTLLLVWLPKTGYELDQSRSLFDVYYQVDTDTMYMELDICLPVR